MKITKSVVRMFNQEFNDEKKAEFISLGAGGHYTPEQIKYAAGIIEESGIRAASRILGIPRRTLQRWKWTYGINVRRCPGWVYNWAENRRRRRAFWARRGYY